MTGRPLPASRKEMEERGWEACDVILVTGDAYVDHPSFGVALIGRHLESLGYRVGIIARPRVKEAGEKELTGLGLPRLFWGITGGNVDSMVTRYTASGRLRHDDAYSPGGKAFFGEEGAIRRPVRPDRAAAAYAVAVRQIHKGAVIVLGGIEASMRRLSHWDFYQSKIRHSILIDSKADILVYGMGEQAVREIARRREAGEPLEGIPGTVLRKNKAPLAPFIRLPSHEELLSSPVLLHRQADELLSQKEKLLVEQDGAWYLYHAPPAVPLSTQEMDALYALSYTRRPHPEYRETIPAWEMIRYSVTAHRGCAGGCRFCGITFHQGREIVSRSEESILNEIRCIRDEEGFPGHITDIGGPSADMYGARCLRAGRDCHRESCLFPSPCPFFKSDVPRYLRLLEKAAQLVKKVSIGSGLRLDLSLSRAPWRKVIIGKYLSGYLNIAPEHGSAAVLRAMGKYSPEILEGVLSALRQEFPVKGLFRIRAYFIAGHPGETEEGNRKTAALIRKYRIRAEAVQIFTPLPMTRSAAFYASGRDRQGRTLPVPLPGEAARFKKKLLSKGPREKN